MTKTITLGLLGAALALGACGRPRTAEQERAEMRQSGSETVASGRSAGHEVAGAARDVGSGVVHGAEAAGHGIVAGARYTEHAVSSDDKRHLLQAEQQSDEMRNQGRIAGQRFRGGGQQTGEAARDTGATVYHAGEYGVDATQHAVGSVRRSTSRNRNRNVNTQDNNVNYDTSVRGGGPQNK